MKGRYFNLSLTNLIYRLRKFDDIIREELDSVILQFEPEIIAAIQSQLYDYGINGQGVEIMSYQPYKPRTIKNKRRKGQPTDRVTLRDTGDFYNSMIVRRIAGGFAVIAKDRKANDLIKKYKPTILRLTNENLKELLHEHIRPELVKRLKSRLNAD